MFSTFQRILAVNTAGSHRSQAFVRADEDRGSMRVQPERRAHSTRHSSPIEGT
jgi:hypothetical protein